ncbi:MAG TPA: hypothetical protein VEW26_14805 [Allosphingosinicella sp.]|nr:hypothetical protein [Allosphingosinicella sp.]
MTARMSDKRRGAFLKALEACGNQTLAAERACVSRSWVCKERGLNPGFDSECRRVIAAAQARLRQAEGNRPPEGWGHLDGVELVVRGTNGRRVQIARARAGQWTARCEERFLEVFAATCNAKAAYLAAGKSKASAYTHRRRWPGFDRRWKDAEAVGYDQLEEALCERGENLFSSPGLPAEIPRPSLPAMTVQEAIQLVKLHQYQVRELGRKPGAWRRPRTLEEVRPAILGNVSAIARKHGLL